MTKYFSIFFSICLLWANQAIAQNLPTFPVNGVQDVRENYLAFTNATIWIDYQTKIEKATLLIKNGLVENVGVSLSIPANAITIDLQGRWIYPSFIDLYSDYGMPEAKRSGRRDFSNDQLTSNKEGAYYWNQAVMPENHAETTFNPNPNGAPAKDLRKAGFGTVLIHQPDGIVRGTGALVSLHKAPTQELILKGKATAQFSFNKGSSSQYTPISDMGVVAIIRQTYLDADWYAKNITKKEYNISLEHFNQNKNLPSIFESRNRLYAIRIANVGKELGINYIIKGSGDEYQRLKELKATGQTFILPLNFQEGYDVADPLDATLVGLAEMKHWELAPSNPAKVAEAGIKFTFTCAGLKSKDDFLPNLRKAVRYGLSEADALKALTFTPANLVGVEAKLGGLQKGKLANFLITSGDIFQNETILFEQYIQGYQCVLQKKPSQDMRGIYELSLSNEAKTFELIVGGKAENPTFSIERKADTLKISPKTSLQDNLLSINFNLNPKNNANETRLSGWWKTNWTGVGETPTGEKIAWQAIYKSPLPADTTKPKPIEPLGEMGKVIFPFEAYGQEVLPATETYLYKNATVWTSENEGVLQNTDVLVKDGKISKIGKNISENTAKIIDAKGKHLTAGIIDEHSHIALFSINEVQSVSAEVRMADVVNSEDINIYRQLAGGTTSAQLLHGSANCIGGQSAIIKLKWGQAPDKMLIAGAEGFIKFALGENPKNGNSGFGATARYPQTRMGVEQVIEDAFVRAKEYQILKKSNAPNFRKDLEMEAVLEILEGKRHISCHSYVQSEINMLIKLADKMGFKVNTFTHILEGYKVGEQMKKHGAGASSFADWWAYKMEVKDAIPHNAAILTNLGITTAINSDDPEMARRLNQEAAKTIKYGGLSEEEALKTVTINPAKLLRLDKRTGSIKEGKDADLVLWSDNPLSIYAVTEITMIEGAIYFDRTQDIKRQTALRAERARLIQKMLQAKQGGANMVKPTFKKSRKWCCADLGDMWGE